MLNNISMSDDKINNGIWRPLLRSEFLIASVHSKRFKQAIFDSGQEKLSDDQLIAIMAKTILLDWKNVKDPNGVDIPYSEQMAVIALTTSDAVRLFVDGVSTNIGFYCE